MKKNELRIGLALGAGGARGMCHIGIMRAFEETGIRFYCIAGSSMGAMGGGLFAAGLSTSEMSRISRIATQGFVMDFNAGFNQRPGLFRARRVNKLLTDILGDKRIEDCEIKFSATAVDVESGELVILDKGILRDAIRASIAIPAVFTPWEIDGRIYMDGGVLCRLPIGTVREMGADIVIAADALGSVRRSKAPKNIFGMVQRYYDITDWELNKDKVIDADILITPDLGDKSQFVFKDNDKAVDIGYYTTVMAMPQILDVIKAAGGKVTEEEYLKACSSAAAAIPQLEELCDKAPKTNKVPAVNNMKTASAGKEKVKQKEDTEAVKDNPAFETASGKA